MFLFNKLIRTDLILLVAFVLLFVLHGDFWKGFLQGFIAVLVIVSAGFHIQHYKLTKKLY